MAGHSCKPEQIREQLRNKRIATVAPGANSDQRRGFQSYSHSNTTTISASLHTTTATASTRTRKRKNGTRLSGNAAAATVSKNAKPRICGRKQRRFVPGKTLLSSSTTAIKSGYLSTTPTSSSSESQLFPSAVQTTATDSCSARIDTDSDCFCPKPNREKGSLSNINKKGRQDNSRNNCKN